MTSFKYLILSLAVMATSAFQPMSYGRPSLALKAQIDEAKIKDAAEHFGKYPVEEIEEMKKEIHKERVQSLMFDRNSVVSAEKAAEQRLIEQELDLQLSLLKKDLEEATPEQSLFPDMTMFPDVEEPIEELPHLKDNTMAAKGVADQKLFIFEEAFLEENVLETLAFCAVLALVMVAPQII
ncbi:expressed unknown protein [Seminavis robusta]|uniref:Uncharacterized protein n=1 Tax=Seminavis robusta TaxID=568900 RepID=A0A9N8D511_9STRA|nr:expressed unknown protein [Seminavis robusta]|eukprot:Sro2_g001700.1 n/a (181) ;mRNA; f:229344-229978